MQYATQCLGVVNNVLNICNSLLYVDRKMEKFCSHHYFLTSISHETFVKEDH